MRVVRVLTAILLVSGLPLRAREEAESLATGMREIEDGRFESAALTLDRVVRSLTAQPDRKKDLATAYLYLGLAHLSLSQDDRARADVREALAVDSTLTVSPEDFPPRMVRLVDVVRASEVPKAPEAPKQGNRRKTYAIILGTAAGVGAVAALAGSTTNHTPSTSPTPSPSPRLPQTAPTLAIALSPDPAKGDAPFTLQVILCGSNDLDGDHLEYTVDWGDGAHDGSGACSYAHRYATPGHYHGTACVNEGHFAPVCAPFSAKVT